MGIHCLDVGTEIVSETSHNVKMAIAGRNHKCGAIFGKRCLDLGTVNAGKTSDNDKMSTAGRHMSAAPSYEVVASTLAPRSQARCRTT